MFTKRRDFQHRWRIKSMYWSRLEKTRSPIALNVERDPQATIVYLSDELNLFHFGVLVYSYLYARRRVNCSGRNSMAQRT